jgi:hypothetical protein
VGSAAEGHTFPFSFGDVLSSVDGALLEGRAAADVALLLEAASSAQVRKSERIRVIYIYISRAEDSRST